MHLPPSSVRCDTPEFLPTCIFSQRSQPKEVEEQTPKNSTKKLPSRHEAKEVALRVRSHSSHLLPISSKDISIREFQYYGRCAACPVTIKSQMPELGPDVMSLTGRTTLQRLQSQPKRTLKYYRPKLTSTSVLSLVTTKRPMKSPLVTRGGKTTPSAGSMMKLKRSTIRAAT